MTKVSAPIEGSPFSAKHVKLLKIGIAIMTGLLIVGIVALFYGMARQASRLGAQKPIGATAATARLYDRVLNLGKGQLDGVSINNEFLILHWKGTAGDIIVTLDVRDGHEVGRIQVPSQ